MKEPRIYKRVQATHKGGKGGMRKEEGGDKETVTKYRVHEGVDRPKKKYRYGGAP